MTLTDEQKTAAIAHLRVGLDALPTIEGEPDKTDTFLARMRVYTAPGSDVVEDKERNLHR